MMISETTTAQTPFAPASEPTLLNSRRPPELSGNASKISRPVVPQPAAPDLTSKRAVERAARIAASQSETQIDVALVHRFKAGEEAAFVEIIARHHERILAVTGRFLRNRADAEEITQDTFIRAHRGLALFRGDSALSTWLHRIAVNLARNRYWYFHRRQRHMSISLDCPLNAGSTGTFSDLVAARDVDPAQHAAIGDFEVIVATCMKKLDASQREILTLRNSLHQRYDTIAISLGISEGTVKSRIARARGKLRDFISEACPEFSARANPIAWFEPVRGSGCAA